MNDLDDLTRDYRAAFLRYLPRRDEAARHTGYELGRSAVAEGISILELAGMHHEIFLEVLREIRDEDLADVATAASEFFSRCSRPTTWPSGFSGSKGDGNGDAIVPPRQGSVMTAGGALTPGSGPGC